MKSFVKKLLHRLRRLGRRKSEIVQRINSGHTGRTDLGELSHIIEEENMVSELIKENTFSKLGNKDE